MRPLSGTATASRGALGERTFLPARDGAVGASPRVLPPERLLLSFNDAAFLLDCGRTKVWELVERGALLAVGKGRGRKVLAASVREYVDSLVAAERRERGTEGGN